MNHAIRVQEEEEERKMRILLINSKVIIMKLLFENYKGMPIYRKPMPKFIST